MHYRNLSGIIGASIISLIRLFQFALSWGELENPPSPRGRLWCDKSQFGIYKQNHAPVKPRERALWNYYRPEIYSCSMRQRIQRFKYSTYSRSLHISLPSTSETLATGQELQ